MTLLAVLLGLLSFALLLVAVFRRW